jgi:8-oxo-dGTP pyrophosphatase MutT (NUDIX family)
MTKNNHPQQIRNATLLFLVKIDKTTITQICLAMKKRGFGKGKWNGVGGKVNEREETIEEAAKRESKEEIAITITNLEKVGELTFLFPQNPDWNQIGHIYLSTKWHGEICESEEMKPKWFKIKDIPYNMMWETDRIWLPLVLEFKK